MCEIDENVNPECNIDWIVPELDGQLAFRKKSISKDTLTISYYEYSYENSEIYCTAKNDYAEPVKKRVNVNYLENNFPHKSEPFWVWIMLIILSICVIIGAVMLILQIKKRRESESIEAER